MCGQLPSVAQYPESIVDEKDVLLKPLPNQDLLLGLNKEVLAGTLPALVERLTSHEHFGEKLLDQLLERKLN